MSEMVAKTNSSDAGQTNYVEPKSDPKSSRYPIEKSELERLASETIFEERRGEVADYIPELKKAPDSKLGISICYSDGYRISTDAGCSAYLRMREDDPRNDGGEEGAISDSERLIDDSFTIQSVSKVFALLHVLEDLGAADVFQRVGKEPTGDPFNATPEVKKIDGVRMPSNPFINVGAILITSLFRALPKGEEFEGSVREQFHLAFERFLRFVSKLCGAKDDLLVDEAVFKSESRTGHNNRALAWTMHADKVFPNKYRASAETKQTDDEIDKQKQDEVDFVEGVLKNYFQQCSILVTADHLAHAAGVLANDGFDPGNRKPLIKPENVRTVVALMSSCGMYDGSGEFAHNIGIPAKSGVGGGIMCVVPGKMGIATYAPPLDPQGNSRRGLYVLESLSKEHKLSVFEEPPIPPSTKKFHNPVELKKLVRNWKFIQPLPSNVKKADYIPELSAMDASDTAISIWHKNQKNEFEVNNGGDCDTRFTLQSIGMLLAFLYALETQTEKTVFSYVGKEPSGESFNELKWKTITVDDEEVKKVPFNPLINAGAIVIASMIPSDWTRIPHTTGENKTLDLLDINDFIDFVGKLAGNLKVDVNWDVFESERKTGFNNRSLAWVMNDKKVFNDLLRRHNLPIDNQVIEDILGVYFRCCSIQLNCMELARIGAVLANGGVDIRTQEDIANEKPLVDLVSRRHVAIACALMSSSGLFDGSGEFAFNVGVPAKSGVSGAILGVVPGKYGVATYSPPVDEKGNSYRGCKMLERIAQVEDWSIFSQPRPNDKIDS